MPHIKKWLVYFLFFTLFISGGCATYYQKNLAFQEAFTNGDIEKAEKLLDKNKKASKDKNRLLYFLQKGTVAQLLNQLDESNRHFEDAYIFTEDVERNYALEAVSYLTNPNITSYRGEDHERVLLHYFKVVNYLQMGLFDEALVECRRINIKLNALNDKYKDRKNRYKEDAFANNLMGIAYEASGDVNNAFIAYRNAYNTYVEDYSKNFGVNAPQQLKQDLLRTAYLNGFSEELRQYEKTFNITYQHQAKIGGELLFFWHNGLGPVKDEFSINFAVVKGEGGAVIFENKEYGLSFPFPVPPGERGSGGLGDLKIVRVAFPKYIERKPLFNKAELGIGGKIYPVEQAENINAIAFKTLEDRILRELGTALLRLATKQLAEYELRKQNQEVGAILSIINAITEKADTRNWQTLPHDIGYARVPLKVGANTVKLKTISTTRGNVKEEIFEFEGVEGKTEFFRYHTLESAPIAVY